jgi:hypothetical protein
MFKAPLACDPAPTIEPVSYGDYLMKRIDKNNHDHKKLAAQADSA